MEKDNSKKIDMDKARKQVKKGGIGCGKTLLCGTAASTVTCTLGLTMNAIGMEKIYNEHQLRTEQVMTSFIESASDEELVEALVKYDLIAGEESNTETVKKQI